MSDELLVDAEHPPDPRTLRWMAHKIVDEADSVEGKLSVLATGTDRICARAVANSFRVLAGTIWNTADKIEAEKPEEPKVILTDAGVS